MKEKEGKTIVKNFFLMVFNTGFMTLISWFISIWIARKLGPDKYGIFSFVLWLGTTFSWAIGMGFIQGVTRYTAEYDGLNKREYIEFLIRYVVKIEVTLSLLTCCIILLLRKYIADFFFSPAESIYITIMAIGLLPGSLTAVFSAAIEGLQKFKYITLASLIISPLSLGVKIVVILLNKGIEGLLATTLFFSFVNFIFYLIALKKEGLSFSIKINIDEIRNIKKSLFSYNKNLFPVLLSDKIVWDKSENFFLGRFCQSIEIAYYNIGYTMAQRILSTLPEVFWRILFPAMSSLYGKKDHEKASYLFYLSTKYLALITFPVGITGLIIAPELIFYLYGSDFRGAIPVLRIMFFAFTVATISSPAASLLYGYNKMKFILWFGLSRALLNIILAIFLIRLYGAIGAALSYGIVTVIGAMGGIIYSVYIMKSKYPLLPILNITSSSFLTGTIIKLLLLQYPSLYTLFVSLFCGGIIYLFCIKLFGIIREEDYITFKCIEEMLPPFSRATFEKIYRLVAIPK